jgi:hypothetical protein
MRLDFHRTLTFSRVYTVHFLTQQVLFSLPLHCLFLFILCMLFFNTYSMLEFKSNSQGHFLCCHHFYVIYIQNSEFVYKSIFVLHSQHIICNQWKMCHSSNFLPKLIVVATYFMKHTRLNLSYFLFHGET